ncbi:MAG: hypothetical protein GVY17_08315 [Cyanobacteria bacterium]|jgi:hypothetical protein|nr:hypothetical protein [Cyanobacteria bacterium GSL.Bin21]
MFIYRTNLFEAQVRQQNKLYEQMNRLCDELATLSVEQAQSRFERIYPFLKRKEGNLRLIARIYRIDKTPILCWLTLFRRGDRAYEEFLRDREHYAHQSWASEVETTQLRDWLNQQQVTPPELTSPPLPQALQPWLERPHWVIDANRLLIYESQTWVKQLQTPAIRKHWERYNHLILDLVDPDTPPGLFYPQWGVRLYGDDGYFLLYAYLITQDNFPREILFLICPFLTPPSVREIASIIQENELDFTKPLFLDDLINSAQRAYPSELIVDEKTWLAIEDESETNLALSAEEETILHSVSTSSPSLPLFLNGQAGSGKSTMLFHLFADYCYRHFLLCEQQKKAAFEKPHPLFLAYNERLLQVSKEQVATLLKYHHRFTEEQEIANPLPKIAPFFKTFRQFLRSLLPPQEREQFAPEKYISFHRFRQLCRQHLPQYSPEKCWLVIRTFIKGYHLDERNSYLTIEDYQEVPSKEKVISEEEFIDIYHRVWHWYYKYTEDTQAWDDQDLIRWVLFHQYYSPDYTVIFCDEAQDFTRLELQLIMRLSVFSQYDLEHEYVPSLPFAFAGDPLQTLNPTGFRWATLKATFYNEVLAALSPTGQLKLEMNFQELVCNYRSLPGIVGVNNLIQWWRKNLFGLTEIEPQKAKKVGDRAPQKFILGKNLAPEIASIYLQNSLIILPCDEAAEPEYLQQDELLKIFSGRDNHHNHSWNILSAIATKGLEFKQVILYKFGEYCPQNLFQPDDQSLEKVKYFFNKLYVAISRATEQLFIIDTPQGEEKLWQYATNPTLFNHQIQREFEKTEKWNIKVNGIQWGNSPELLGEDDPEALAAIFMSEGFNRKNPDLLWRAQQAYHCLQEEGKAALCQGEALKLEGKFTAAGECFLNQQQLEAAWHCFWQGMAWQELNELYQHLAVTAVEIAEDTWFRIKNDYPLIAFMAQVKKAPQTLHLLQLEKFTQFIYSRLNNEQFAQDGLSQQWQTALTTYAYQISHLLRINNNDLDWKKYGKLLAELGKITQQKQFLTLAGACYFHNQNYQQAVQCWEASSTTGTVQYYRAKAYLIGLPNGLPYLAKIGAKQEILQAWKKANQPFKREWLSYVVPILEISQDYESALRGYCYLNQKDKVNFCFQKLTTPTSKLILFLASYYIYFQHWDEMITTLEMYLPRLLEESITNHHTLITRLANSKLTPNCLSLQQRQRLRSLLQRTSNFQTSHFPIYHFGVLLEKMGSLGQALKFYEAYVADNKHAQRCKFARQRWLAIKKKQALYCQKQGQKEKAKSLEKEFYRRAKSWNFDPRSITAQPPQLLKKQVSIPTTQQPALKLPPNTKVQSLQQGILQLQVRHLNIRVMQAAKQILITDLLTQQTFRVDALTHQVKIGEMILKAEGEPRLSFMSPSGNFAGRVTYQQEKCRLELQIQGISEKIQISL